jgi:hypothetical protein
LTGENSIQSIFCDRYNPQSRQIRLNFQAAAVRYYEGPIQGSGVEVFCTSGSTERC